MSARTTGISITPRRGLARAACPQAIFISSCTNLRRQREGEATGRADHGRIAARPGSRLVHHRDPVFLCVGIPRLVVAVILISAEGGQVTQAPGAIYTWNPPGRADPPN